MRLIDSDWLLDKLSGDDPANMEDYYYNAIKDAPTIEAEPVRHGEWRFQNLAWRCSQCKTHIVVERTTMSMNYCPNCGAKMDGGRRDATQSEEQ